ncbi:MAG TPA: RNA-binding protein [Geobacter sp.]|nr:RNA-binding protein [Geobacter sp.]
MAKAGKELYVGSLSYDVTEYELEKLFAVSGKVTSIHLITDPVTGEFKRCGYVRMATEAEASDAIASLDGAWLIDKHITVSYANPQKMKPGGGGLKGRFIPKGAAERTAAKAASKPAAKPAKAATAKAASAKPATAKPAAKADTAKPSAAKPATRTSTRPATAKPAAAKPAARSAAARPSAAKPAGRPATAKPSAHKPAGRPTSSRPGAPKGGSRTGKR